MYEKSYNLKETENKIENGAGVLYTLHVELL
jgi:hypothetical protein